MKTRISTERRKLYKREGNSRMDQVKFVEDSI